MCSPPDAGSARSYVADKIGQARGCSKGGYTYHLCCTQHAASAGIDFGRIFFKRHAPAGDPQASMEDAPRSGASSLSCVGSYNLYGSGPGGILASKQDRPRHSFWGRVYRVVDVVVPVGAVADLAADLAFGFFG
jgi:hypothetical protein